ncbi:MAG: hypothetical protein RSH52_27965, partial [Janthinobacterium sp.]
PCCSPCGAAETGWRMDGQFACTGAYSDFSDDFLLQHKRWQFWYVYLLLITNICHFDSAGAIAAERFA